MYCIQQIYWRPNSLIFHLKLGSSFNLKGQARLLVLLETRGVDKVQSPDESENTEQDPTEEIVAEAERKSGPLSAHPLIHQCHCRPRHCGSCANGCSQRCGDSHALGSGRGRLCICAASHPSLRCRCWQLCKR